MTEDTPLICTNCDLPITGDARWWPEQADGTTKEATCHKWELICLDTLKEEITKLKAKSNRFKDALDWIWKNVPEVRDTVDEALQDEVNVND